MKTFFLILSLSLLLSTTASPLDQDDIVPEVNQHTPQEIYSIFSQEYGAAANFKERFIKALDADTAHALAAQELVDKIQDPADLFREKALLEKGVESFLNALVAAEYLTEQDKEELLAETRGKSQQVIDFHSARFIDAMLHEEAAAFSTVNVDLRDEL